MCLQPKKAIVLVSAAFILADAVRPEQSKVRELPHYEEFI